MGYLLDLVNRRNFLKTFMAGLLGSLPLLREKAAGAAVTGFPNPVYWVTDIPTKPFSVPGKPNYHAGLETLLRLMGARGLKFYRSPLNSALGGPNGMIHPDDVVLIKVNAQWKYRGCTNSDLIRGLVQRILDHPDGFNGEVVIFENGQGRGSLNCDTSANYPDASVHANANNPAHSFVYLVDSIFKDSRVSYYLLDPIRETFILAGNHKLDGYVKSGILSWPCFTTSGGHRVELRRGIWTGESYSGRLKLINVPVLKTHGGSEFTASVKHFYGVLSMDDGNKTFRHSTMNGLGRTCGSMISSIKTPVLNIIDAIWVSHLALTGYPAANTHRANQLMASQDPVALDMCAARKILYPIDRNPKHLPSSPNVQQWLTAARDTINASASPYNPLKGVFIRKVTKTWSEMVIHKRSCLTV